ncbi:MAG: HD domain-containing protein [Promethearchaeota archaeon]
MAKAKRLIQTGRGFELELPTSYEEMKREAEATIAKLVAKHPKAKKMWGLLRKDAEVNACWDMANYIAVGCLKYNDHGDVHARITAANALKMLKLLLDNGVQTNIMEMKAGDEDDVYLVVLTAALLHDLGNQVHREDHHLHSVYLAIPILNRLLPELYKDPEVMFEIRGHILHAIYAHPAHVKDLTKEAALVGIADGTDMTKGRGRMAFDSGNVNIHSVSALAIEKVEIKQGTECPIQILVHMSNSAGIFQLQDNLGEKLVDSPLEDHVEIVAQTSPVSPSHDQRILHKIIIRRGRFEAI